MAKAVTDTQNYSDIANAIRAKAGTTDTYTPSQMAAAIAGISTGTPVLLTTVSLPADWTESGGEYTQTVSVDGGTANSKVDLQPDAAALQRLMDDGVTALWVENDNGVFTARALGAAPGAALAVQATVTEAKEYV